VSEIGLVIRGFKRHDNLKRVLDSSALEFFPKILVSLDAISEEEEVEFYDLSYRKVISDSRYSSRITLVKDESHQGMYSGMRHSIDSAFEIFTNCVVLEEDCIPSKHLPKFLTQIETLYPELFNESHICLSRHVKRDIFSRSLSITKYPFVWGWMASRDVWNRSRIESDLLVRDEVQAALQAVPGGTLKFVEHWMRMFDACVAISIARKSGSFNNLDVSDRFVSWALNSWATPYTLAYWTKNNLNFAVRPNVNLIRNIGFDRRATHTFRKPNHAKGISHFPLLLNGSSLAIERKFDEWEDAQIFGIANITSETEVPRCAVS